MLHMRPISMSVIALFLFGLGTCSAFVSSEVESNELIVKDGQASFQGEPEQESYLRPIPTAVVQVVRDGQKRIFPGKVRANRRAELAFTIEGRLVRLNAQEGARVKKGQVLAQLDQRDFIHALQAARAKFQQAERNLGKFRKLHEQQVVTETQFQDVKTIYDIALADLNIREKALADTTLHAPFDGVVVNRHIENYGHVKKEESVLSLQDISGIEVTIQVPERVIARGGTDGLRDLQVLFDADPDRGHWHGAKVREYSVESDKVSRTYDVVVTVTSPVNLNVYPGMTASVSSVVETETGGVKAHEASKLFRVPVEAVWRGATGDSYVWEISLQGGHPAMKSVELVALRGDCAEVKGDLRPGMHVAIAGVHALSESALVRPQITGKEGLDG